VAKTNTQMIEYVPRSIAVAQSELQGKTTIEAFPDSDQARIYQGLVAKIAAHTESRIPEPLPVEELRKWATGWADQILAIETGEVRSAGGGI
jgi:nitrogenase iron protein NifH